MHDPHKRPSNFRTAWTAARLAGRRVIGRKVSSTDTALGEALASQLDDMKGLAMKLGQIVSYMDVPLPDEVQQTLSRLQTGVTSMPAGHAEAIVATALGAPVPSVFERFDPDPVAAASIGQVHRARWESEEVAVKVQYPDIASSFGKDLGAVSRLAGIASAVSAVDGKAIVAELRNRLEEECDYLREAEMQSTFARAFSDEPGMRIPRPVESLCRANVLTTTWLDGDPFATLLKADPERRNEAARLLVRFSYSSLLNLGLIQADPHPGNFLFGDDWVGFLDFGCVRAIDEPLSASIAESIHAVRSNDRALFAETTRAMGLVGKPKSFDYDHFFMVMEHLYRPFATTDFQFDAAYVREGLAYNGPRNPNSRTMTIPGAHIWVMRLQWGLWHILAKLNARGDFGAVFDEALSWKPSTKVT